MDTSSFENSATRDSSYSGQDGRTPRVVHPSIHSSRGFQRLKKSTYYGILLYILENHRQDLSENQILWIIYFSRKLDESQLLRSVKISTDLIQNEEFCRRMSKDVERIRNNVPRLEPKKLPEVRRIGTGYHDKGSLRPLHERRNFGESVIWDEDISYLLPLNYDVKGTWITAVEVCDLIGIDLLRLVMNQLGIQKFQSSAASSQRVNLKTE